MSRNATVPAIDKRYICIADRDALALAAVISSYLFRPASYVPLFLFPPVKLSRTDEDRPMTDGYLSNLMGSEASILINNAWARMGGGECVILAGLTQQQKSFLSFPSAIKIIEIKTLSDIQPKLSSLAIPERDELRYKTSDILKGLFLAQKHQKRLMIDESAEALPELVQSGKGIVVVENVTDASPVIAINYANSVDANILIVDPLPEHEGQNIQTWIQEWKERGDCTQLQKLKDTVSLRLGNMSFTEFQYATFFTEGLPYSLVLENAIPCSYVHLSLRPDLFVINSIIFEHVETPHAAVVFSPIFFLDEETNWLCDFFSQNKYYVRTLVARDATLANFDFHAQFFPYDLLHICSHGGQVKGYEMSEHFVDRGGKAHVVEFDEVVAFSPVPDNEDLVEVHRKAFPRKLDAFVWMSEELKKQDFPQHVYEDMWKAIIESSGRRKIKGPIPMSCCIGCVDSIHQGQFHTLASHSSPLVFNNSCYSWHEVAVFFLACGARGYVGTLWAIGNQAAVIGAQTFYENVFSGSVLAAFHKAVKAIDDTDSKNIYIYWGLHFTTLSPARSPDESESMARL
jgi:hypothetical protein